MKTQQACGAGSCGLSCGWKNGLCLAEDNQCDGKGFAQCLINKNCYLYRQLAQCRSCLDYPLSCSDFKSEEFCLGGNCGLQCGWSAASQQCMDVKDAVLTSTVGTRILYKDKGEQIILVKIGSLCDNRYTRVEYWMKEDILKAVCKQETGSEKYERDGSAQWMTIRCSLQNKVEVIGAPEGLTCNLFLKDRCKYNKIDCINAVYGYPDTIINQEFR